MATRCAATLMRDARAALARAGVEDVETNVRVLVEAARGERPLPARWPPAADTPLPPHVAAAFVDGVARRVAREPLQYIAGEWDFDALRGVACAAPVLIPRPETEELVRLASDYMTAQAATWRHCGVTRRFRFLEVGCGTGAVTAALLTRHPGAVAAAIDVSPAAVALTRANCARFGVADRVAVLQADATTWAPAAPAALTRLDATHPDVAVKVPASTIAIKPRTALRPGEVGFDMVVANLPYIPSSDMRHLPPEVRDHEDPRALDGGDPAGAGVALAVLRNFARSYWLRPFAPLLLETAPAHPALLAYLLAELPPAVVASRGGGAGGAPPPPDYTPPEDMDFEWLATRTGLSQDALAQLYRDVAPLREHYDFVTGYEDFRQVPRFVHLRRADVPLRADDTTLLEVGAFAASVLL